MPVLVEQYVVVGGQSEAQQAAQLWRFGPKAFKGYFNIPEPAAIQRAAENEVSIEKVVRIGPLALTLRPISPRCESYGRAALPSLTFTPARPTSAGLLISAAPRCCPRSEGRKTTPDGGGVQD